MNCVHLIIPPPRLPTLVAEPGSCSSKPEPNLEYRFGEDDDSSSFFSEDEDSEDEVRFRDLAPLGATAVTVPARAAKSHLLADLKEHQK